MICLPDDLAGDLKEHIRAAMRTQHYDHAPYHQCSFCYETNSRYGEEISHYDCWGERMLRFLESKEQT